LDTFLIVNADDLGRSSAINQGVISAFTHGIVTSTSLMVNFPAFAEAADLVLRHHLPVGIHFNLTEGHPVLPSHKISSLIDDQGCFWPKNHFISRWFSRRLKSAEICCELQAQVQKCLDLNLRLDHFDSHHHIHGLPRLGNLFHQVALQFGIVRCRFVSRAAWSMPLYYQLQQQTVYWANRWVKKMEVKHPDYFYGFEWMHLHAKEETLLRLIAELPQGISELMCHPSAATEKSVSKLGNRVKELEALCSSVVKDAVNQVVPISFEDLR